MIELGDTVKCKYTGFKGVAVAKTIFINGCVQYSVAPKWDGKAVFREDMSMDEESLVIIKKKKKPAVKRRTGGPNRVIRRSGF